MGSKIGVLVFPAGEVNSVELHDALSTCVNIRLYGASSVDRHGGFIFKNYISEIPPIQDSRFLDELTNIIRQYKIDVVIPTHDDVALFLAENRTNIPAKILTAEYQTALICRDKKKTYEIFADCGFCPEVYTLSDAVRPSRRDMNYGVPFGYTLPSDCPCGRNHLMQFPAFLKPRKGQGSVNTKPLYGIEDIPPDIDLNEYVVCEYLPGKELTVDCFTSHDGKLQAVLPRSRQRIFGGISVRAQAEPLTKEIQMIAETINARLNFLGLWYFQIRQDQKGDFKLLEVSARCAGTMCLSRARGINLPLLSVYAAMGRDTEILGNEYALTVDRTLISRYQTDLQYDRVYIDLDDTILVNGEVNLQIIRLLYQCVNNKKKIVLLTRHRSDHDDHAVDALKRCRIAPELFDEIIEIPFGTPKYTKIQADAAVFIDNAYAERKAVREHLGIPVFDVDGIEVLLDWRT